MTSDQSEDFKIIQAQLDELEVDRLTLGFWRMFAQGLLMRADKGYAREVAAGLISAIKEASTEVYNNRPHVQDALLQFGREVNKAIDDPYKP